jgi:hypothetical protein
MRRWGWLAFLFAPLAWAQNPNPQYIVTPTNPNGTACTYQSVAYQYNGIIYTCSNGSAYTAQTGGSTTPGTTTNSLTGAASGGAAPGTPFNGSSAVTFDYHTLGAVPLAGGVNMTGATGGPPPSGTLNFAASPELNGALLFGSTQLFQGNALTEQPVLGDSTLVGQLRLADGTAVEQADFSTRIGVGLPVPYVTPNTTATPIAFDIAPSAGAANVGSTGMVAWIDICNVDITTGSTSCATTGNAKYQSLRLGISTNGTMFVNGGAGTGATVSFIDIGTNTAGVLEGKSGTPWDLQAVPQSMGTQTISGCSLTANVGGNSAGLFYSGTTGTCTVTITPGMTANNGYRCEATDLTTGTDTLQQTATSTTTCTVAGVTVSGDVITWQAIAF